MFCPNCGAPTEENALFCGECGETIARQDNENQNGIGCNGTDVRSSVSYGEDCGANERYNLLNRLRNNRKQLLTVLVSAVLVVGAVIILLVLLNGSNSQSSQPEAEGGERMSVSDDRVETTVSSTVETTASSTAVSDSVDDKEASVIEKVPVFSKSLISEISASSYMVEEQYSYSHEPSNVIDEDLSTAWVENVNGNGEGQSITFGFAETCLISGFMINNGYQKNSDTFTNNSRVKDILVSLSDGHTTTITLDDYYGQQKVGFDSTVKTESITFTIASAYPGAKYSDTAISEISLF